MPVRDRESRSVSCLFEQKLATERNVIIFGPWSSCVCAGSAAGEEPWGEIDHPMGNTPHKKDVGRVWHDDPTLFP